MFSTFFYNPIYNLIVFLLNYIGDTGVVIIIGTLIIKVLLFPLYNKQINNQLAMKKAKPELDEIKERYKVKDISKEERQKIALETMAIYKKYGIKPFSMIFLMLIQIPVIFALYWVFYKGDLPAINTEILYSFISEPQNVTMNFLNYFDLKKSSIILALLAGISQYSYFAISMPDIKLSDFKKGKEGDFKKDLANSMQVNLKFGLPIFITILLTTALNSAIALYWITSNIFAALQEYIVRNKKQELKEKKD